MQHWPSCRTRTRNGVTGSLQERRSAHGDTGIGIDDEARRKLFPAFTQADSSTARRFGGTGLGLAISQQIVGLLGGEIGCESTPGSGSTFWFRVPLGLSRLPPEELISTSGPSTAELRLRERGYCRILVVDDSELNQLVVRSQLEELGLEVDVAGNGAEALAALEERSYELVLMDCEMPGLDGYETTGKIRRRQVGNRHTPIIALTGRAMKGDRERCLGVGMNDYLTKPFRRDELIAVLDRWLPPTAAENLAAEVWDRSVPASVPRSDAGTPVLDPERIEMLSKIGRAKGANLLASIAPLFISQGRSRLEQLHQATTRRDAAAIALNAHGLKGSAGNLGATALADLCNEVEVLASQDVQYDFQENLQALEIELQRVEASLRELVPELRENG